MKGLIVIPDITGFTSFVKNIDMDLGAAITSDLLNTIIDSNTLELEVSEIEGDAVLFYKLGRPFDLSEVFEGLKKINEAFRNKLRELKAANNITADLSLKFIVHYGELNVYNIKGFKKLYGQTVIEAHCLLKNGDGQTNYILFTQDYISAIADFSTGNTSSWIFTSSHSTIIAGLRTIDYCFYTYAA
jgi:hypothetical protein